MDDDLEKANTILREVMTYRKKTKDCYARHQPTPSPFWDSLFQKTYPLTNETSPSCVMLQEQIRSYIAQGCEKFSNELLSGTIPETLYNGIQFYLNYILHVIHVQIPDEDIKQAALSHANQIDALNEYSIGALLGVMKFVFYGLYNPLSGELVAEKDHRLLFSLFSPSRNVHEERPLELHAHSLPARLRRVPRAAKPRLHAADAGDANERGFRPHGADAAVGRSDALCGEKRAVYRRAGEVPSGEAGGDFAAGVSAGGVCGGAELHAHDRPVAGAGVAAEQAGELSGADDGGGERVGRA